MIQLIALDLDGTTLTGDNVISERNRNALLEAMAQGVLVVPATGRTFEKCPPALENCRVFNMLSALTERLFTM